MTYQLTIDATTYRVSQILKTKKQQGKSKGKRNPQLEDKASSHKTNQKPQKNQTFLQNKTKTSS